MAQKNADFIIDFTEENKEELKSANSNGKKHKFFVDKGLY